MNQFIENLSNPNLVPSHADCKLFGEYLLTQRQPHASLRSSHFPRISGVYGLIQDDQIHYIGKSVNAHSRIRQQRMHWTFDAVGVVPVDSDVLELVEFRLIRSLKPKGNTMHVNRRDSWGRLTVDEIADALNATPGEILEVCAANDIKISNLLVEIKPVIWHFSRR